MVIFLRVGDFVQTLIHVPISMFAFSLCSPCGCVFWGVMDVVHSSLRLFAVSFLRRLDFL